VASYDCIDPVDKRKKRKKCDLSVREVIELIDCVTNKKMTHEQTAAKFKVKRELVNNVMCARKRDNRYIEKQLSLEDQRRRKLRAVFRHARV
jgi:hypothetical protein